MAELFTAKDETTIREWLDRMARGRGYAGPLPAVGRLLAENERLREALKVIEGGHGIPDATLREALDNKSVLFVWAQKTARVALAAAALGEGER